MGTYVRKNRMIEIQLPNNGDRLNRKNPSLSSRDSVLTMFTVFVGEAIEIKSQFVSSLRLAISQNVGKNRRQIWTAKWYTYVYNPRRSMKTIVSSTEAVVIAISFSPIIRASYARTKRARQRDEKRRS